MPRLRRCLLQMLGFRGNLLGELWANVDRELWRPALRWAETDANGRARLPRAAGETLTVQAVAAGFAAAHLEVRRVRRARLRLLRGDERRLHFTDPRGRPLGGVVVLSADGALPTGRADETGGVTLRLPPGDVGRLLFLAHGGHSGSREAADLQPDAPFRLLPRGRAETVAPRPVTQETVELDSPIEIHGRVVDSADQQPVAGAWVWRRRDAGGHVRTAAGGDYRLLAPAEIDIFVIAAGEHYVKGVGEAAAIFGGDGTGDSPAAGGIPDGIGDGSRGCAPRRRRDPIGDGGRRRRRHPHRLPRPLVGRRPLPDRRPAGRDCPHPARPQAGLCPGRARDLAYRAVRRALRRAADVAAGDTRHRRVLALDETPVAGAEVRATTTGGQPADYLEVLQRAMGLGGERRDSFRTDAGGRFEIPDLGPGHIDLEVTAAGFAPLRVPGLEIPPAVPEVDLGTVLLAPGVTLEGRITDAGGEPLAGVEVRISDQDPYLFAQLLAGGRAQLPPADARSDAGGRFTVVDRRRGEMLSLAASKPGYVVALIPGVRASSEEPIVVVMAAVGRLAGRVVDDDGQPVAGAYLAFHPSRGADPAPAPTADPKSDRDGRFAFDVVPGVGTVYVHASGFLPFSLAGVEVPAAGERPGLELALRRGATLSGRVRGPGDEGLNDAWVRVFDAGDPNLRVHGFVAVDGEGNYRIMGLPIGNLSVAAEHEHHQRVVKDIEIAPGDNALDLTFAGGARVSGRVFADGTPVSGVRLHLLSTRELSRAPYAISAADGGFAFRDVPSGTYTLEVSQGQVGHYYPGEASHSSSRAPPSQASRCGSGRRSPSAVASSASISTSWPG